MILLNLNQLKDLIITKYNEFQDIAIKNIMMKIYEQL